MSSKAKASGKQAKSKAKANASSSSSSSSSMGGGGGGGGGGMIFSQELYWMPPIFAPDRDPEYLYGIVFLANRRIMKRCFQAVVRYLDPQSVMKLRMTTKEINREGERAMYRVWRYLVAVNLSSRFIRLPTMVMGGRGGGDAGQMSYTRGIYELFFANNRHEVLIMGGNDDEEEDGVTNNVFKMIIEQDGTIRFEDSTPMLQARYRHNAVYHQGEVLSIGSFISDDARRTVERLDTLTQTRMQLQTNLPVDVYHACAAVLDNKVYIISL